MIIAALTVVRAWFVAGCPGSGGGALGSFDDWDRLVRRPIVWLSNLLWQRRDDVGETDDVAWKEVETLADPVDAVQANFEQDPDTAQLGDLLRGWEALFGDDSATTSEAIREWEQLRNTHGLLEEQVGFLSAIEEIAKVGISINALKLGRWISQRANRIVDKRRFVRDGLTGGSARWRVRR
jgi:hypothetical protein